MVVSTPLKAFDFLVDVKTAPAQPRKGAFQTFCRKELWSCGHEVATQGRQELGLPDLSRAEGFAVSSFWFLGSLHFFRFGTGKKKSFAIPYLSGCEFSSGLLVELGFSIFFGLPVPSRLAGSGQVLYLGIVG